MDIENEFPKLLKAGDVASILNISRAFAYQLMKKGEIPTVKILGSRRVRPEDLRGFIQQNVSKKIEVDIK